MVPEGWTSYELRRPPDVLCQFARDGGMPFICKPSEFYPEFNISGLYWRLTGIGREYLDSLPPEMRTQMKHSPSSIVAAIGAQQGSAAQLSNFGQMSNALLASSPIGAYFGVFGSLLEDV